MSKAEPHRTDFAYYVSISYAKLGDIFVAIGNVEQASNFYQKAIKIQERLSKAEPHRADFAFDVSVCYIRLGDTFVHAGDLQQAKNYFQQSLEIRERLLEAEPQCFDFARGVAISCNKMAQCCTEFDTEEGRSWLRRARDILASTQSRKPFA